MRKPRAAAGAFWAYAFPSALLALSLPVLPLFRSFLRPPLGLPLAVEPNIPLESLALLGLGAFTFDLGLLLAVVRSRDGIAPRPPTPGLGIPVSGKDGGKTERTRRRPIMRSRSVIIVYLVIGVVVAVIRDYVDIDNLSDVISFALAVVLWPLVLLDVDLHVGGGGRRRRGVLVSALPMLSYLRSLVERSLSRQ